MNAGPDTHSPGFLERLRKAGIEDGDSPELALNKQLLMFATGLLSVASMLWVAIYWALGPLVSVTYPYLIQLALVGNVLVFIFTRNFNLFRVSQLVLFLFAPFALQWGIGSFIDASGLVLWGLLAPVGAILFFGVRESIAWFLAWAFMIALSGLFDYLLIDPAVKTASQMPLRVSAVFFALNFLFVSTMIYLLLRYAIAEKRRMQERLEEAHRQLQAEQYRSEKLLLNILPAQVAARLKNAEDTIADGFPAATVMFADLVNFTRIAAAMTPEQVFGMLNSIFSAFDDLCERFGLEKIKTIGDAYMAAGGLNTGRADHTAAVADLALEMQAILQRDFRVNAAHMQLRIGIATGPVVAGVVGKHKFIYDVWGDTVNLASRLTSGALPGSIHCDARTFEQLADRYSFDGPLVHPLKGKGSVEIYELTGRKG